MSGTLQLFHWEPNGYFLKPLIALHEKGVAFASHWFDPTALEQFDARFPGNTESALQLEREGPLLVQGATVISSSFFMLEYIAEALPGPDLCAGGALEHYRARASGQFLTALGADVSLLGCARYLAPVLRGRDQAALSSRLQAVEPLERRNAWLAFLDGTYTEEILAKVRERLKFPVGRVEQTLAARPWLAGPAYSIADIDAFAMLRPLARLVPELIGERQTPRIVEFLQRMEDRQAVRQALALSRSGKPHEAFVPGAEPSRWG
ncbi:MAG TPA: glutathione S-transferase [Steroidobacteraceae bacterium]|nr:glutathione S-transferase [Steroidobacteraceae bacterium]